MTDETDYDWGPNPSDTDYAEFEYPHISEEKPTALTLTQQEWDDLADIVKHSIKETEWMAHIPDHELSAYGRKARRQSALAERIIEANQ